MDNYKSIKPSLAEINSWSLNEILKSENLVTMSSLVSAVKLEEFRERVRSQNQSAPSYTALILKAVTGVIKRHPEVNRAIIGPPFFKRIIQFNTFDMNVAVEKKLPNLPGQAYSPTIRDVDKKNVLKITEELKYFANSDETNNRHYALFMRILKYAPWPFAKFIINIPYWFPHLWLRHRGGACWVNSPSKAGADLVFTAWPWPVTFSFGVVQKRPMVKGEVVAAELSIPLLMVFDRRLMGGGPASRIFAEFKKIVETGDAEVFVD